MIKLQWMTEKRKISDLIPAKYNPRKLSSEQAEQLKKSIDKFEVCDPIIININNVIIGGHQRIKILKQRGDIDVDVRVPSRELSENEEKELNLRLNKNLGEWDLDLLLNFDEAMLKDIGFDSNEIDRIFETDWDKNDDRVPDNPPSLSALGDVFIIGDHRIMCGSATDFKAIDKLMCGIKADMFFTDPPYNINYSGRGKNTKNKILNDDMDSEKFLQFLKDTFVSYSYAVKDSGPGYICYASRTHREFENAVEHAGYKVSSQIIWNKSIASMGWGDYRWKHEPILYVKKQNVSCEFFGDRKQYTVWDHNPSDDEILSLGKNMIEEDVDDNGNTVWFFNRDSQYKHPTQKPVSLCLRGIVNSSVRGGVVLDLFSGSGSTLIACEKSGRKFYGMELSPRYVDTIIKRYEDFTGIKAVKL